MYFFIHICRINVSIHSSYLPGAVTEIKCDAPGLHNCWPRGEAPVFARFGGEVYHFIAQWFLGHHSCGSGIFHCDSSQWNHEWWSLVGWSWNFQSLVGWSPNFMAYSHAEVKSSRKRWKVSWRHGGFTRNPKYLQVEMFKAEFGADVWGCATVTSNQGSDGINVVLNSLQLGWQRCVSYFPQQGGSL